LFSAQFPFKHLKGFFGSEQGSFLGQSTSFFLHDPSIHMWGAESEHPASLIKGSEELYSILLLEIEPPLRYCTAKHSDDERTH